MRTYQFRGQRVEGKGWTYGRLAWTIRSTPQRIDGTNGTVEMKRYPRTVIQSPLSDSDGFRGYQEMEVIPETVGQFIEKWDKNKKPAYEGDVVESIERDVAFEIKWNHIDSAFMFYENMHDMWYEIGDLSTMEITSSIHDSPELIK